MRRKSLNGHSHASHVTAYIYLIITASIRLSIFRLPPYAFSLAASNQQTRTF